MADPARRSGLNRRALTALLAVLGVLLATGIGVAAARRGQKSGHVATRSVATTSTTAATTTTSAPVPTTALSPEIAKTLDDIKAQVSELRGLPWMAPLDISVEPVSEFVKSLNDVNARDRHNDRIAGDGDTYKLLQLIPRTSDYSKQLDDLYDAAVIGFYDPRTKKLLIRANQTDSLTPNSRLTIAHEMDHALTDQHFDFGDKTDALDKADKQEDLSGFVGLLEGDAKKMEQLWSQKYLTAAERNTLGAQGDMAAFNAAPQFLRDSLLYPYTTGAAFVARLYQDGGGWRLVDAAYGNPPTSTAAVLHPERYAAGLPWTPPDLPAIDKLTGCALDRANTLGEFDMIELLDEHLSLNDAVNAANGWDGDAFQLVRCGTALGMVDRWQATDAAAAARLASALRRWAGGWDGGAAAGPDGRFAGSAGAGRVVVSGSRVDLVVADDAATADRVAGASGLAP